MKQVLLLLSVFIFSLSSCSKEEATEPEGSKSTESGFFYAENSASAMIKADEATANKQHKTIIAKKSGATVVEIVLTDLKAGTYDLSARYAFTYVKSAVFWEASAGTLTITKNDGSKLSGTFKATAGSGVQGVTTVEGKFTDIEIK